MKRKKILIALFWMVVTPATLYFYFLFLGNLGDTYRKNHKEKQVEQKTDTLLNKGWKFHSGDDAQWASADFKDSAWATVRSDSMPSSYSGQLGWFRLKLKADSAFLNKPAALEMYHWGASEIYFDGEKVAGFGKVASDKLQEENLDPGNLAITIQLHHAPVHQIAVRYSNQHFADYKNSPGLPSDKAYPGFKLNIKENGASIHDILFYRQAIIGGVSIGIFLLTLSLLHFLFFIFYRKAKENLYYSLFVFCYAVIFLFSPQTTSKPSVELVYHIIIDLFLNPLLPFALLLFIRRVFNSQFPKWLWACFIAASILSVLDFFTKWINPTVSVFADMWLIMGCITTMLASTYHAIRNKAPGAKILGTGISVFALLAFTVLSIAVFNNGNVSINPSNLFEGIIIICSLLSIPICMSIYLAYSFALTNKTLSNKLIEVEELSAKTLSQEKEKQEILSQQKEKLELQVIERTKEISGQKILIEKQKQIVEEKNKDIVDSINYAKRLQDAILPPLSLITQHLPESFVMYKPKDIVAGDFYWVALLSPEGGTTVNRENSPLEGREAILISAADCTGHGVPGALVSVVCSNALNRTVKEFKITEPGKILDKVRELVLETFEKSESNVQDGMDISLAAISRQSSAGSVEVRWSGAFNSLWYVQNGEMKELPADKQPIGKTDKPLPFSTHNLSLSKGDTLYLFTDGYADQFGGPKGKKFKYKALQDLLLANSNKSMAEQKQILEQTLEEWKGNLEQVDDVLIIGIRT